MDQNTVDALLELNRNFYQDLGSQFSATRQRIQPGVNRIIAQLAGEENILDLGCGNSELYRALDKSGFRGTYIGLDFSGALPNIASIAEKVNGENSSTSNVGTTSDTDARFPSLDSPLFVNADLSSPVWDAAFTPLNYDIVFAFAVLHHLPGFRLRQEVLLKIHKLLAPQGSFIHSEWQFLNSARLRDRIQPWEKIGLSEASVEGEDYLLDWRRGGYGLRYVHHFTLPELSTLAARCGFQITETFNSDGEGSILGLYQTWMKQ